MANRAYGYQGHSNRGYQFETSPKKVQPEFEPNDERDAKQCNKPVKEKVKTVKKDVTKTTKVTHVQRPKMTKEEFKKKASFVVYIVFGFTVLFTISYRNSIINEKFNEKENLKSELANIQKQNEQLKVTVENELNLTSVEKIAKETLGMSKLNNNQKVYVSLPKREYVETQYENISIDKEVSVFEKIFNEIKNFFS